LISSSLTKRLRGLFSPSAASGSPTLLMRLTAARLSAKVLFSRPAHSVIILGSGCWPRYCHARNSILFSCVQWKFPCTSVVLHPEQTGQ
jgi:hypothetical protein